MVGDPLGGVELAKVQEMREEEAERACGEALERSGGVDVPPQLIGRAAEVAGEPAETRPGRPFPLDVEAPAVVVVGGGKDVLEAVPAATALAGAEERELEVRTARSGKGTDRRRC